tara:strand:- start:381 stop:545 length:165 start_codon:yes stop_codon:yes gene_type:complete
MKCVKIITSGVSVIERVHNETAALLVREGKATYICKAEWKQAGRAYNKRKEGKA